MRNFIFKWLGNINKDLQIIARDPINFANIIKSRKDNLSRSFFFIILVVPLYYSFTEGQNAINIDFLPNHTDAPFRDWTAPIFIAAIITLYALCYCLLISVIYQRNMLTSRHSSTFYYWYATVNYLWIAMAIIAVPILWIVRRYYIDHYELMFNLLSWLFLKIPAILSFFILGKWLSIINGCSFIINILIAICGSGIVAFIIVWLTAAPLYFY